MFSEVTPPSSENGGVPEKKVRWEDAQGWDEWGEIVQNNVDGVHEGLATLAHKVHDSSTMFASDVQKLREEIQHREREHRQEVHVWAQGVNDVLVKNALETDRRFAEQAAALQQVMETQRLQSSQTSDVEALHQNFDFEAPNAGVGHGGGKIKARSLGGNTGKDPRS